MTRATTRAARGATSLAAAGVAATAVALAAAQTISAGRPRTIPVGTPAPGARAARVDAARTGRARTELPASGLRTEWRIPLGMLVDHAPLVDARGGVYVVGTRGEVIAVARDGTERWRTSTGAAQPGPPALLSDDTLVFVDAAGQAVGVRGGAVRWRVRFGRGDAARPAPMPLDDGGVVVATSRELSALDADGRERARTVLPEATTLPLVAALGKVLVVSASGAVWSWQPGADEVLRVASFGSAVEGGAAMADDRTLVAVTAGGAHLCAMDLQRGGGAAVETLAVASGGLWIGPPAVEPAATHLALWTATGELAVALDRSGAEVSRSLILAHSQPVSADGGVAPLSPPAHAAPLVDAAGTFAFATPSGGIGVASPARTELLSQERCEPPIGASAARGGPAVSGLAPLGDGAVVVACHAGALLAVRGDPAAQRGDDADR